jgi:hypothetical protein
MMRSSAGCKLAVSADGAPWLVTPPRRISFNSRLGVPGKTPPPPDGITSWNRAALASW